MVYEKCATAKNNCDSNREIKFLRKKYLDGMDLSDFLLSTTWLHCLMYGIPSKCNWLSNYVALWLEERACADY